MRLLEIVSLLALSGALVALTFRAGSVRTRRVLFGATAGLMGLQALVEGARWQLFPAYIITAACGALVFLRSTAPRAGAKVSSIRRVLRALRVALAAAALSVAVILPASLPVPSFPSPEGPHPVGTVRFLLEDPARADEAEPGRPRRLMAQAWYPADASAASAPRARYLPDVVQTGPALSRTFGLPSFFASHLAYASSHSHENVPFAPALDRAPLLVFSHGHRLSSSLNTTTLEALASQGYVVIALEHTYDAAAVVFPDGAVALSQARVPDQGTDEDVASKTFWVGVRAADVRFLLDTMAGATSSRIPDILARRFDAAQVGVLGFSLGGGTAAEVCRTDARVAACADIDGLIYGEATTSGVTQPFLLIENEAREDAMDAFVARLRGPSCRVRVAGVTHVGFSDIPAITPLLSYFTPRGQDTERGDDTVRETNQRVTAFFDATLRRDRDRWSRVRSAHPRFSTACDRLPAP
ncbi:alpha/beta hydrolase family protein [Sorangium sp. So ce887]|uniref:alpha/beta hydrolase family protein n=1 Tax=Sorangium sp. So ce887 TaxID=3133324 RepID=UPI003F63B9C3